MANVCMCVGVDVNDTITLIRHINGSWPLLQVMTSTCCKNHREQTPTHTRVDRWCVNSVVMNHNRTPWSDRTCCLMHGPQSLSVFNTNPSTELWLMLMSNQCISSRDESQCLLFERINFRLQDWTQGSRNQFTIIAIGCCSLDFDL